MIGTKYYALIFRCNVKIDSIWLASVCIEILEWGCIYMFSSYSHIASMYVPGYCWYGQSPDKIDINKRWSVNEAYVLRVDANLPPITRSLSCYLTRTPFQPNRKLYYIFIPPSLIASNPSNQPSTLWIFSPTFSYTKTYIIIYPHQIYIRSLAITKNFNDKKNIYRRLEIKILNFKKFRN